MNFQSFHEMLESIEPLIEGEESRYLFNHIDQEQKAKVKVSDLKKCLSSNGINLHSLDKHR